MDLRTAEQRDSEEQQVAARAQRNPLDGHCYIILDSEYPIPLKTPEADSFFKALFGLDDLSSVRIVGSPVIYDILVEIGVFASRGDAKKNWLKTEREAPRGLSSFVVGKKKIPLTIFRPLAPWRKDTEDEH